MTDPLALRAAAGDPDAWREIVSVHGTLLKTIAYREYRLSPDAAADAVQETWLRLLRHAGGVENLPAWLTVAARHACLDRMRRDRRYEPCSGTPEVLDQPEPDHADIVIAAVEAARAVRLARALSPRQLRALAARAEGLSLAETAAEVGCSEGTAKSHLSRARAVLRAAMERGDQAEPPPELIAYRRRRTEFVRWLEAQLPREDGEAA